MPVDRYREICAKHRWNVPADFNIAAAVCRRHAEDRSRVAIHREDEDGARATLTYHALQQQADRLSNALASLGVRRGDTVAIILPQRPETAIAHIACYQLGAIAVPLSFLFGPDALEYRLNDSAAKIVFVDAASLPNLAPLRDRLPHLRHVIGVAGARESWTVAWEALQEKSSTQFTRVATRAIDPALLVYTSGTTGPPKGALMPQQCLLGNLPGSSIRMTVSRAGDVFLVAGRLGLDGRPHGRIAANTLLWLSCRRFPRALRAGTCTAIDGEIPGPKLVPVPDRTEDDHEGGARAVPKTQAALAQHHECRRGGRHHGVRVGAGRARRHDKRDVRANRNELYRRHSHTLWPAKPGSMGRPYPGHRIAVVDDAGVEVATGEIGEVAVHRTAPDGSPDPVFFLEYYKNPEGTARKFTGEWCRTGDLATRDADGYLWYQGRADDMFKAAGYRIGPSEIENCLIKHPAVANAAVVPSPDETRGNIVKAFIVLAPGVTASGLLEEEIQRHVRKFLAPYEYPKAIGFIDALPMTTTGKVQRRVLRERELKKASGTG
jgi:acetyl-CoA synthetase